MDRLCICFYGFNVTILASLFSTLFVKLLGKRRRFPATGLNSLGLVAVVMALANPDILWDVGFQLSFMATLGLVQYAEPLSEAFLRLAGPVSEYVLLAFAAQITTLPVIAYHFKRTSLVSFLVSPLILPAQSPVMIVGGLALCGFQHPRGGVFRPIPWRHVGTEPDRAAADPAVLRSALRLGLRPPQPADTPVRPKTGVVLLGLGLVTVLVWRSVLAAPDGRLHLEMLDVGSGDAFLIQTPTGRYVLADGSPSTRTLSDALGRRLPLDQRRLDWVVVTGTSSEQIAALPDILPRFTPGSGAVGRSPIGHCRRSRPANRPSGCKLGSHSWCCLEWGQETGAPDRHRRCCRPCKAIH